VVELVLICDVLWYGVVIGLFQIKMQSVWTCHANRRWRGRSG